MIKLSQFYGNSVSLFCPPERLANIYSSTDLNICDYVDVCECLQDSDFLNILLITRQYELFYRYSCCFPSSLVIINVVNKFCAKIPNFKFADFFTGLIKHLSSLNRFTFAAELFVRISVDRNYWNSTIDELLEVLLSNLVNSYFNLVSANCFDFSHDLTRPAKNLLEFTDAEKKQYEIFYISDLIGVCLCKFQSKLYLEYIVSGTNSKLSYLSIVLINSCTHNISYFCNKYITNSVFSQFNLNSLNISEFKSVIYSFIRLIPFYSYCPQLFHVFVSLMSYIHDDNSSFACPLCTCCAPQKFSHLMKKIQSSNDDVDFSSCTLASSIKTNFSALESTHCRLLFMKHTKSLRDRYAPAHPYLKFSSIFGRKTSLESHDNDIELLAQRFFTAIPQFKSLSACQSEAKYDSDCESCHSENLRSQPTSQTKLYLKNSLPSIKELAAAKSRSSLRVSYDLPSHEEFLGKLAFDIYLNTMLKSNSDPMSSTRKLSRGSILRLMDQKGIAVLNTRSRKERGEGFTEDLTVLREIDQLDRNEFVHVVDSPKSDSCKRTRSSRKSQILDSKNEEYSISFDLETRSSEIKQTKEYNNLSNPITISPVKSRPIKKKRVPRPSPKLSPEPLPIPVNRISLKYVPTNDSSPSGSSRTPINHSSISLNWKEPKSKIIISQSIENDDDVSDLLQQADDCINLATLKKNQLQSL
ncbi:hypothetical protein GEMRC1_003255 [Eukaryota sp. GEM-RC1]